MGLGYHQNCCSELYFLSRSDDSDVLNIHSIVVVMTTLHCVFVRCPPAPGRGPPGHRCEVPKATYVPTITTGAANFSVLNLNPGAYSQNVIAGVTSEVVSKVTNATEFSFSQLRPCSTRVHGYDLQCHTRARFCLEPAIVRR